LDRRFAGQQKPLEKYRDGVLHAPNAMIKPEHAITPRIYRMPSDQSAGRLPVGREEAGSFGGYAQTTDKQRGKTGLSPEFIEFEGGPIAAPLCGIALTLSSRR
jgi:hypothetical protein